MGIQILITAIWDSVPGRPPVDTVHHGRLHLTDFRRDVGTFTVQPDQGPRMLPARLAHCVLSPDPGANFHLCPDNEGS